MKKHLYEIKRKNIPSYLKWWFIRYKHAGVLSEVLENLTSPITLQNSLRRKFKIFQIGGNSVQDGEPTLETTVSIQNVTGNVHVKVQNKNLLNLLNSEQGGIDANGNYITSNSNWRANQYIEVKPSTTYTFSANENITLRLYEYNSSKEFINPRQIGTRTLTITTTANTKYIKWTAYKDPSITADMVQSYDLQLELSSTATDYIAHEEQTATLHLPEGMKMCSIEDYEDVFEKEEAKWYKKKVVYEENIKSNLNSIQVNNRTPNYCQFLTPVLSFIPIRLGYSNIATLSEQGFTSSYKIRFNVAYNILGTTQESTLEEQKTALINILNNLDEVIFTYVLATPILEEITDKTLITELNNLKKLYSYKDITYISSDNEPSPKFKIQYVKEE